MNLIPASNSCTFLPIQIKSQSCTVMASISFPLSNNLTGREFSAASSPGRHQFRFSASCATAERAPRNALQTASFYEVLGVQNGATCQEIKSAYRKLARVLHPDVSDGRGDDTSAADEFMRLHEAYATLSDPEKRAVYDRSLFRLRRTAATPLGSGDPEVTRRRRTWETDQCW